MSINGYSTTTTNVLTADDTASEKLRYKLSKILSSWLIKKCSTNSYSPVRNLGNCRQIKYWLLQSQSLRFVPVFGGERLLYPATGSE